MSGSALNPYAFYEHNHRELMFKTFAPELGGTRNMTLLIDKVLKLDASELVTRLIPALPLNYNLKYIWTGTVEGKNFNHFSKRNQFSEGAIKNDVSFIQTISIRNRLFKIDTDFDWIVQILPRNYDKTRFKNIRLMNRKCFVE